MILSASIGNTNIRCALGAKDHYEQFILTTKTINRPEDFISGLEERYNMDILANLQGSILCSVVPVKTPIISEAIYKITNKLPQRINASKCNVDVSGYKSNLGEDRIVCCEAAFAKYPHPLVIIDLGTATTINVVNSEHIFMGGAILAGVQTGLTALSLQTAQLPQISDFSNLCTIGKNTKESLISGAIMGTVFALEGYLNHISTELCNPPTVVVTGGNAPAILPHCMFKFHHEPNLLLDGLFMLYQS